VTQGFVVVTNVCSALFGGLFEAQCAGADSYSIAILKLLLKVWLTVYEYFVSTSAKLSVDYSAVNDSEYSAIDGLDVCVISGGSRIVEHDSIVGRATNCANGLGNKTELPLTPTCVGDLEVRHAEVDPSSRRKR
jgi:hypothetical protein